MTPFRSRFALPPFSRDADFYALRPVTAGGVDYVPGDPFDKAHISERLLRQLYEQRRIRMAVPGDYLAKLPPRPSGDPPDRPDPIETLVEEALAEPDIPLPERYTAAPGVVLDPRTPPPEIGVKHVGHGRYVVTSDGAPCTAPSRSKAEVEAAAAVLIAAAAQMPLTGPSRAASAGS